MDGGGITTGPRRVTVLSNNVRQYRQKAGLTQANLAELVDVSRKTVNTVENGIFIPSTVLSLKLAAALGVTVEELFFLSDETE